jgi:membrane protein
MFRSQSQHGSNNIMPVQRPCLEGNCIVSVWIKELLRRIRRDIVWHDCFGKAAELGFYFQLAIFPLLIFLLSLIAFIPEAQQIILFWLGRLMPAEATKIIEIWVQEVISQRSQGILSLSLIFSLASASTGVRTLRSRP